MWHKHFEGLCRMTLWREGEKSKHLHSRNYKKPVRKWQDITLAAALHMSATILPDTRVSKMLVVAKLNTFSRATCWHNDATLDCTRKKRAHNREEKHQNETGKLLTLKMSSEHCVRMVLKVEDSPSSTKLSKWVIFSVSVSSRVCSSVLLSIKAKHLKRCKKK